MELGRLAAVALVVAASVPSGAARAQDEQPAAVPEARRYFDEGVGAMDRGHLEQARELFARSLELEPRPPTAFNLAIVHRAMGDAVGADRVLAELLEGQHGELSDGPRREVAELRRQVRDEIARITVQVRGAAQLEVRIDGRAVATVPGGGEHTHVVNRGSYVVEIASPDGRSARDTVRVERGRTARVTLTLPPPILPDDGQSVFTSPWLWIGAGVVLAAGATVLVWALLDREQAPITSPDFPVVEALRGPP